MFRELCLSIYKLDLTNFLTLPGLAWQAALRVSRANLQLITDTDKVDIILLLCLCLFCHLIIIFSLQLHFMERALNGGYSAIHEMEAKAITQCALNQIPMNSLKGYYGHTLGAAGMIESIIACRAIQKNMLIQSLGFEQSGVSCEVSMITKTHAKSINRCLKSSSGFGGCNAVAIFSKNHCN